MKPGDTIDRFMFCKKLGHGGMGGVFIGFDPRTDSLVAIKVLFEEFCDDDAYVKRFEREAKILSRLAHPNIVQLVDHGIANGRHYMALEYVKGKNLADLMGSGYRFTVNEAMRFIKEALRALAYAHACGVVHRDIKPENIMIPDGDGPIHPKILDFGVAFAQDSLIKTQTGNFIGTLTYAPPEQVQGQEADERADIYSIGLVLYEILTERKAIVGNTHGAVLQQQLEQSYIPPNQINPLVPAKLGHLVLRALRADPVDRFQSSEEFLYRLEEFDNEYQEMAAHSNSVFDFPEFEKQFREANAAFESKDYQHALSLTQDLAQKAPRAAEVFFLLGKVYVETGYVYNAIEEYIKATAFNPKNSYYQMCLGLSYQSIGAYAQAKSALEAGLNIDPDSVVIKQRLTELERVVSGAAAPAEEKPVTEGGTGAGGAEAGSKEWREAEEKLAANRPAEKNPTQSALGSLVWWGWGPLYSSPEGFEGKKARARALKSTGAQITSLAVFVYLATHPAVFDSNSFLIRRGSEIHKLLNDPTSLIVILFVIYALLTLHFAYQAYLDALVGDMVGYVIPGAADRNQVRINLGEDRRLKPGVVFYIFAERKKGSGTGKLIGRLYVREVGATASTGVYHPDTSDRVRFGDLAVSHGALARKLTDPRDPVPGRFVELPEELRVPATVSS